MSWHIPALFFMYARECDHRVCVQMLEGNKSMGMIKSIILIQYVG